MKCQEVGVAAAELTTSSEHAGKQQLLLYCQPARPVSCVPSPLSAVSATVLYMSVCPSQVYCTVKSAKYVTTQRPSFVQFLTPKVSLNSKVATNTSGIERNLRLFTAI